MGALLTGVTFRPLGTGLALGALLTGVTFRPLGAGLALGASLAGVALGASLAGVAFRPLGAGLTLGTLFAGVALRALGSSLSLRASDAYRWRIGKSLVICPANYSLSVNARSKGCADISGISFGPLRTLLAGVALRALGTGLALGASLAGVAFRPLWAGLALEPLLTGVTFWPLGAGLSLGSLFSGVAFFALRPLLTLGASLALRALFAGFSGITLRSLRTLELAYGCPVAFALRPNIDFIVLCAADGICIPDAACWLCLLQSQQAVVSVFYRERCTIDTWVAFRSLRASIARFTLRSLRASIARFTLRSLRAGIAGISLWALFSSIALFALVSLIPFRPLQLSLVHPLAAVVHIDVVWCRYTHVPHVSLCCRLG